MSEEKTKIVFTDAAGPLTWVWSLGTAAAATLALAGHRCEEAFASGQTTRAALCGALAVLAALVLGWVVWGSLPRRAEGDQ